LQSSLGEEPAQGQRCELLRGIQGFVLYAEAREDLAPALRELAKGHLWLPPEVLEYLAGFPAQAAENQNRAPVTPREAQVLALLAEGLSDQEIAAKLRITERTVKFHVANIFDRLGVPNRQAAAEAADSGSRRAVA
jgi:DNA-binding NarL/FixJ family response regulator